MAAIHSCRGAEIHGAEGASRRVVSAEDAQGGRTRSDSRRGTCRVVAGVETARRIIINEGCGSGGVVATKDAPAAGVEDPRG